MKVGNMKQSRFISKSDLPEPPYGVVLTIVSVQQENVASQNAKAEIKWTIKFAELQKPFVMNVTNAENVAVILGDDETDHWGGGKVELYYDPTIMMGPERKGGIRIRPPQHAPAPVARPDNTQPVVNNAPISGFDDDIPL